ncbi:MAG: hypothetical protein AAFQ90_06585 [Pseudomonadota bacterium]
MNQLDNSPARARAWFALGVAGACLGTLGGSLVLAQRTPESLLPPGFEDPLPTPTASPTPPPSVAPVVPASPAPGETPVPGSTPAPGAVTLPPVSELSDEELRELPTVEELEQLTTDELDDLFGLKPQYDIPPAARRSLAQVGLVAPAEGGFPIASFGKQPPKLVRAALSGTAKPLVSRWGHILFRRALASRLQAPDGMEPVEFAALRAGALNRLGEYAVARALIQDVDTANWSEELAEEALTAFIAQADPVGLCPFVRLRGAPESDGERAAQWTMIAAICNAYAGETALAGSQLDAALREEIAPPIDILLARRFAGAAGRGRRGVEIEWEGVDELNPWRFAFANAVGEPVPEPLLEDLGGYYHRAGASAAMLPLARRAQHAARAGEEGIFSAQALVDLYSKIYSDAAIGGAQGERARSLRMAYLAPSPAARVSAMEALWQNAASGDAPAEQVEQATQSAHWAQVMTAYAAARVPPAPALANSADGLIASMLAAGLERDALAWKQVASEGTIGWALLALADPQGPVIREEGLDAFADNDASEQRRKSQFLVASLAGLGRISAADRRALEGRLSLDLDRETRWVRMIRRASEVKNPALVAMLAGLGMQGDDWSQMTPLHLFHITAALSEVGLKAHARMIAAEAVARG